jgi:hypothetical protein
MLPNILTFVMSLPAAIPATGITAFGTSITSCAMPTVFAGLSVYYSYKVNKNKALNTEYLKSYLAMQTQLHQVYSSLKVTLDAMSVVKSYSYSGKLNLNDNVDTPNLFKFAGFIINGVNPITSTKNIAVGIFGDKLQESIVQNVPIFGNNLNDYLPSISSKLDSSIEAYNKFFNQYESFLSPFIQVFRTTPSIEQGWVVENSEDFSGAISPIERGLLGSSSVDDYDMCE